MNFNDYDELERRQRVRRNKIVRFFLVLTILFCTHFGAFKYGQNHPTSTLKSIPIASISIPTSIPTNAPTIVPTPVATPTSAPKWQEIVWEYMFTDLMDDNGSTEMSLMLGHDGCFTGLDLWDCDGKKIMLRSENGRTYYINDYENKLSYVIERSEIFLTWSNNMQLSIKQKFDISKSLP